MSADPQEISTSVSQAGSSYEDSTSQADSASSKTHIINSQGASTTLPQAPKASRKPNSANTHEESPRGNSLENSNPKWVINLSSKALTQTQRSLLAKGPNFVVTPRHPPNLEYITAIEAACTKLGQQDAEELRTEINRVLRSSHPSTKALSQAIRELNRDRDHIVLTADKGVAMVIMDRQDYINKCKHLLNQPTYRAIPWDPTNTIKTN